MAVPDLSRASDTRLLGYRFAGVVLDLRRQTLVVDGRDVPSTPLMLHLLQILCAADGHLLKRQELFDRLWPGGQEVSDSSLSQLVWRLRSALGAYGELVATVRRSGLRLDASVSAEFDFHRLPRKSAADEEADSARPVRIVDAPAATATTTSRDPARRSRVPAIIAVVLVAAAIASFLAWQRWIRDPSISAGYALNASDLQATRPDTASLVKAALDARIAGEGARAKSLMQSVHESDPGTPIPALFLAWWTSQAAPGDGKRWLDEAHRRITPQSSPYVRLFSDYFTVRTEGGPVRGPINALVALRPQAWYLQYSGAHDQLANRELAGALRSLQQIPLDVQDAGLVAEVVADRISLGDPAAPALATSLRSIAGDPVQSLYVRGRAAYSRGDLPEAIDAFDRCRTVAGERREYELQQQATVLAAIAAIELDSRDAAQRVDAATRLCHDQGDPGCEAEMLGLHAFVAARSGDPATATATLADAWARNPHDFLRPPLLLVALENGLPVPGDVVAVAKAQPMGTVFGGVSDLLLGWDALARGDRDRARQLLGLAREHGIAGTYHAEDALLLGARLGETPERCRIDPPYPNKLRLAACIDLRGDKKS